MKRIAIIAIVASLLVGVAQAIAAECSVGVSMGRVSIGKTFRHQVDHAMAVTSDYVTGSYTESTSSTATGVQFNCELRYGLRVELGLVDGVRATGHVHGTATYQEKSTDFDVDAVLRARGYMASVISESRLSARTFGFLRLGAMYVQAMGDVYPYGREYSVHAEKKAWVPVVGVGVRVQLDDRWSGGVEYRLLGATKVSEVAGMFQYSFH